MIDITHDPRAALEIVRYHTWRHIRAQTVGEHSCQITRIMLSVWNDVPRKLLVHAALHDTGEMSGDIPYPFKVNNQKLKIAHGEVERDVRDRMSENWGLPKLMLSHDEEKFFKMCEYVEMWEYALTEQRMGNQYATVISERCILQASRLAEGMSEDIRSAMVRYVKRRTEQENPEHERTDNGTGAGGASKDSRRVPRACEMHSGDYASDRD